MTKTFRQLADITCPVIDADAHVNEPPDLWQTRVPHHLRDRAPKLVHADFGDVWSFDGGKRTWNLGLTATAGLDYTQYVSKPTLAILRYSRKSTVSAAHSCARCRMTCAPHSERSVL